MLYIAADLQSGGYWAASVSVKLRATFGAVLLKLGCPCNAPKRIG